MLKRFCCKWSIATGIQIIGFLQLFESVFILALYTTLQIYTDIAFMILPLFCFLMFLRMQKKDGTRPRRQFFCAWFLSEITMTVVLAF